MKQFVHTQHICYYYLKSICFGCARQPSSASRFPFHIFEMRPQQTTKSHIFKFWGFCPFLSPTVPPISTFSGPGHLPNIRLLTYNISIFLFRLLFLLPSSRWYKGLNYRVQRSVPTEQDHLPGDCCLAHVDFKLI
jgi:hypothetical protein